MAVSVTVVKRLRGGRLIDDKLWDEMKAEELGSVGVGLQTAHVKEMAVPPLRARIGCQVERLDV